MKIFKKTAWFGVFSSEGTEGIKPTTQRSFTKTALWQKTFSEV